MIATVRINMDNAAFEEFSGNEVARILRRIADKIEENELSPSAFMLYDVNGNSVGKFEVSEGKG